MQNKPLVSIVIPVYNDEDFLGRALDSCINQTLIDIEIICVDDASTDGSRDIAKKYVKKDNRIKLIEQPKNMSALQARKVGVESAKGDYILSLDGDDELDERAVELSYTKAIKYNADVVAFGVKIPPIQGRSVKDFEESLMPKYNTLIDEKIIAKLFNPSGYMRGGTGGYMYSIDLLKKVYKHLPSTVSAYRANDQIVSFAALAQANCCVSIKKQLYTYHLADGNSAKKNIDYKKFLFYVSGINSVEILHNLLDSMKLPKDRLETINSSYNALRIFIISGIAGYAANNTQLKYREKAIDYVINNFDATDLIVGIGSYKPHLLKDYIDKISPINNKKTKIKHVALLATSLMTGGISSVIISQARYLLNFGYKVTIFVHKNDIEHEIPSGIEIVSVDASYRIDKLNLFMNSLKENDVDAIINHSILYNTTWAPYMTLANLLGVKTIGWIHSFSLRSAHDLSLKSAYLRQFLSKIDRVVVLSKKDVVYWKMLGYKNIYYLPNPPSPLLLDFPLQETAKNPPKDIVNILWLGRLQQSTKRVYELLKIASHLRQSTDNFKLTLVGPESDDITYDKLQKRIDSRGLSEFVEICGPKHEQDLIDKINESHIFIYTSDIEGYGLVITEVQAHGLPVIMYELPWLSTVENNTGLKQIEWGNAGEMAQNILDLINSPIEYKKMSTGSIDAAKHYMSYDFGKLYTQLLDDDLDNSFSPEPVVEDVKLFIEQYEKYSEHNATRLNALEDRYEKLKEREKLARKQVKIEKAKLVAIKKTYTHKIGRRIIKPIKRANRFVIKLRNRL